MEKTYVKINIIKNELSTQVKPAEFDNVIFAENSNELYTVSQIVLSGKYNKTYTVIAYFVTLHDKTVLVDGDRLFICLYNEIAVIDLTTDKVIKIIHNNDGYQLFGIYKFKSGYFVHGELFNIFLGQNLELIWEQGCVDIFFNSKVENELEVHDDYIAVYDWYGYRHFYNEAGLFSIEDHPEFSMSEDTSF